MEPTEENRRAWDTLQRARVERSTEQPGIPEPIRALLPDLAGKHVLHEQCGTGETSAELAALGAMVTGIDVAEEHLVAARRAFPGILFLQADPHELPVNLRRRRFDLVYASGLLPYLHDLAAWLGRRLPRCARAANWSSSICTRPAPASTRRPCAGVTTTSAERSSSATAPTAGAAEALDAGRGRERRRRRRPRRPPLEEFPTLAHVRRQDPRVPGAFALLAKKIADEPASPGTAPDHAALTQTEPSPKDPTPVGAGARRPG